MKRTKLKDRKLPKYTKGEEIMNMTSHIVGGAIGIVALVLCIIFSSIHKDVYAIIGSIIYGISITTLFTMSSIYHGLTNKIAKLVFQIIDHCTIYILIAGTYTPIILCSIRKIDPSKSLFMIISIWLIATIGIILNSIDLKKYKIFSMISYLLMGWLIVFTGIPIKELMPKPGIMLLLIGGIAYTIGALLYVIGAKKRYFHFIFHIFVDIGALLHFLCILLYVI